MYLCVVMRKSLAIFLVLVHLMSGVGVFATLHYCGDKITQWTVLHDHTEACSCDEVKKEDCCNDVRVESKLHTEATPAGTFKLLKPLPVTEMTCFLNSVATLSDRPFTGIFDIADDLRFGNQSVKHRVLRI